MATSTVTARDILTALYRHYSGRWAMLSEVTARPAPRALADFGAPLQGERRIDALLVRANRDCTGGTERLAIEVKVSRGDFLRDVHDPSKQAPWRALAHRHAYAVPLGLVRDDEVPADSGLIVVTPSRDAGYPGAVKFARRCPRRQHDPGPLPMPNILDAFYRSSRLEAEAKGYGYNRGRDTDDPAALLAEVKRLRHELDLATDKAARATERARDWQRRYAAHKPPACSTCQQPLHPARGATARHRGHDWEHRDEFHATLCEGMRRLAAEEERDTLPADDYRRRPYASLHVSGPEPVDALVPDPADASAGAL